MIESQIVGFGRVFEHPLAPLPDFTKEQSEAQINQMPQQGHKEERKSQSQVNHSCFTADAQIS